MFFLLDFGGARTATHHNGVRKYVVWCLICGGISCLLGVMFLGVYFLVRSYTSTVGYFETVPTFVPATLVSTRLFFMILYNRAEYPPILSTHTHPQNQFFWVNLLQL